MNPFIDRLAEIGLLSEERLVLYHQRVRDRDDVQVLQDTLTEVIVLSSVEQITQEYYQEKDEKFALDVNGVEVSTPRLQDNVRRAKEFSGYIAGKNWLDFGSGLGGMLDELSSQAALAIGLEPNLDRAEIASRKGHHIVSNLDSIEDDSLDVVTVFHVLEHLLDPLQTLSHIRRVLKKNGIVLIEVPHARDALFSLFDCGPFKDFTFWSEHLVLHTRNSLSTLLKSALFRSVEITGYQRYPLSNHLHWLAKGKPGGSVDWGFLNSLQLDVSYASKLGQLDRTDTLIAISKK